VEEGFVARSASVLDLGGEEEDLEEREGLGVIATFGELVEREECGWREREGWAVEGEVCLEWRSVEGERTESLGFATLMLVLMAVCKRRGWVEVEVEVEVVSPFLCCPDLPRVPRDSRCRRLDRPDSATIPIPERNTQLLTFSAKLDGTQP
jgi:hypothetical protein